MTDHVHVTPQEAREVYAEQRGIDNVLYPDGLVPHFPAGTVEYDLFAAELRAALKELR